MNSKSLDSDFSRQALSESGYLIVSSPTYSEGFVTLNLVLDLRGNLQLFAFFKVTLFDYKVPLIEVAFL